MQTILSGIQPSGNLTIGNYIGAIRQWKETQEKFKSIFLIVDLHAITVPQNPQTLRKKILEVAKLYIACGINPDKSLLVVQSDIKEHAELGWILSTITSISELARMTQFKEKSGKHAKNINAGLFNYPTLMAADILLYKTNLVPVGEDQAQHLELTRTLSRRFNKKFGNVFVVPEGYIPKTGSRIMGLDDPQIKMSKSSDKPAHYIALLDDEKNIKEKIKKAVTDSGREIKSGADKPALTNLLTIFSGITEQTLPELEKKFKNAGYAEFKDALAQALCAFLKPIQEKFYSISDKEILKILESGAKEAKEVAANTMREVREKVGLIN